ncbi:MAG TPA: 4-(cytidine 5'-diphospho)-2-C-methyl-D-erythritol kinase [Egibacteraceae bacterium]|nr:4-(cytidine 5'-diphospho)-2-C-methyl-D-erythritol kinase [Egibacteraceae bacterium]
MGTGEGGGQRAGSESTPVTREIAADGPCVTVRVPAKVNLFLAVRGVRDDGYHELVTVMQTVSLYDRLRVAVVGPPGQGHHPASRRRMGVELWKDAIDGLPGGERNLAVQAALALGEAAGVLDVSAVRDAAARSGARTVIDLDKGIPIAGGMAGGSADAAAALTALNRLWGCELSKDDLREVGAGLGSDVPFCVVGGTALGTGRGSAIAQVLCRGTFHWVVCQAEEPLSTADVYGSWDEHCKPSEIEPDAVLHALRTEDAVALGAALHNDLEAAAFALRPELEDHKKALLDAGAVGAVLSGSGPTLLALTEDEPSARALAERVADQFRAVTVARSPAGGPEVVSC